MPTLPRERPDRMYRRGRAEDSEFRPEELLFRRYMKEHWVEGQFTPAGFKFPKQSVNREKYSEPEDVLFAEEASFEGWGVLQFSVSDIPPRLFANEVLAFIFFPKHVPEEDNYAHSEIWCDQEERTGEYVEPSKKFKKLFRSKLSQRVSIRIEASK